MRAIPVACVVYISYTTLTLDLSVEGQQSSNLTLFVILSWINKTWKCNGHILWHYVVKAWREIGAWNKYSWNYLRATSDNIFRYRVQFSIHISECALKPVIKDSHFVI